jgi:hypothetical protein
VKNSAITRYFEPHFTVPPPVGSLVLLPAAAAVPAPLLLPRRFWEPVGLPPPPGDEDCMSFGDDWSSSFVTLNGLCPRLPVACPVLTLPNIVMALLHYFNGRPTNEAVDAVAAKTGIRLEPALIRKMVDFGLLIAPEFGLGRSGDSLSLSPKGYD